MAGISIGDITSTIDSYKRRTGSSLRQLVSDPMEFMRQAIALQMGPSAEAQADPNALLASPGGTVSVGGIPGVMTYHGTPHTWLPEPGFPQGRFRLDKIGTGEGGAAFERGAYKAENLNTARTYKHGLSRDEIVDANGNVLYRPPASGGIEPDLSAEARAANALAYAHDAQSSSPFAFAGNLLRRTDDAVAAKKANEVLANWKEAGAVPRKAGNVYAQDLPDEVLPKMLQWDKPISEQPESVRNAVMTVAQRARNEAANPSALEGVTTNSKGATKYGGLDDPLALDGASFLELLKRVYGNSLSDELRSLGIPGVSYLDQGSRAAGKGTMNHVVWDQDLLDRMSKTLQKVE